jgi:SNF2 family DNA or RNA helicase
MASITIHVDSDKGEFLLSGNTSELWTNRRARFYLKDYLNAYIDPEEVISIPFLKDSGDDKEKVMSQVQEMLEKFNYDEVLTESTQQLLNDFLDEKQRFADFSEKAKKIWNNEPDPAEFRSFTDTLKKELTRTLYDLQLLSAYHLAFSQNACNFSVPGAGKTSVVYAAYAYLKSLPKDNKKYVNKLLIIGPLSSFGPWEDEYEACFGEAGTFQRLAGGVTKDEKVRHFLSPFSAEITLMSYQGVASSLDDLIAYLRRHENNVMVVLDEAHKIKNTNDGVWARSVLSIAKYCKSRVVLTGTPAPNGYEDIYNLYNFIWPDKNIIDFPLYQLKEMSSDPMDKRIPELGKMLSPYFIRITKKDLKIHMGLPEAIEHAPIQVRMGPVQRKIYDFIEQNYVDYFQGAVPNDVRNELVKARWIRLIQVATNPALLQKPIDEFYGQDILRDEERSYDGQRPISNDLFIDDAELIEKIIRYHELEVPAKYREVGVLTQEIIQREEKVIIWGIFIQTIKELRIYLSSIGIDSKLLIGETPVNLDDPIKDVETRENIIKEFNSSNSSFQVIIANPVAVAESISLHKACHNAIYLERNFNVANFLQSKDRIHRVGLKPDDKINYYYVLSENSIDGIIHSRLMEKEQNMLRIIESNEIPFINQNMDYTSDPTDDIKALIADYVRRTTKDR